MEEHRLPPRQSDSESLCSAPKFHDGMGLATLIGVALVAIEHYGVLIDRPILYPDDHLALGKIGVFLFLILSGYRAGESQRHPQDWLWRRLVRIFPAYWIVLSVAFLSASATKSQPFDIWQMAAQFAGIGYFTHADTLILDATWFLSPLLACYFATWLARLTGFAPRVSIVAVVLCVWLLKFPITAWTCLPYLAYAMGFCLASVVPARFQYPALTAAGVAVLSVTPMRPHLPKLGLACLIAAAGMAWQGPIPGVKWLAERSYEFYLVHGLAFYGALRYWRLDPIPGAVVAVLVAILLTEVLFRTVAALIFLDRPLGTR